MNGSELEKNRQVASVCADLRVDPADDWRRQQNAVFLWYWSSTMSWLSVGCRARSLGVIYVHLRLLTVSVCAMIAISEVKFELQFELMKRPFFEVASLKFAISDCVRRSVLILYSYCAVSEVDSL